MIRDGKAKPKIIVIVGPTAAGKTATAIECSRRFCGEIVSADSMQIYRYMDIGTAKPTDEERRLARHHLVDIIDPDETFSAARYVEAASDRIDKLSEAGKLPVVTGGTGLYVDSLLGGLIDAPEADNELRLHYGTACEIHGTEYVHDLLRRKDPAAAARIHPRDRVRIIRALEVLDHTGTSIVTHQKEHRFRENRYRALKVGVMKERKDLFQAISDRVDDMAEKGLARETENLLSMGYDGSCGSMQAFCYRHMMAHLEGAIDLDEALRRLKRDTRNYAKRQLAWFKRDTEISWYHADDRELLLKKVQAFCEADQE